MSPRLNTFRSHTFSPFTFDPGMWRGLSHSAPTDRRKSTLAEILDAIRDQLVATVSDLREESCYVSLWIDPIKAPVSDRMAIIVPGDGTFDYSLWDGGGRFQMTSDSVVTIALYSATQLDIMGQSEVVLFDSARGLSPEMVAIANALAGFDPVDSSGNGLLREPMSPTAFQFVATQDRARVGAAITFRILFDWAIAAQVP